MRGAFIVLEGLDRSGKSTQVTRVAEYLNDKGIKAANINFPNRTTAVGSLINSYLQSEHELDDAAVHLLFAANRWEAVKSLKSRLNVGETVVCDRYAFSGVAFTSAKGTLSLEWCKNPDRGLPAPDAVIYLDVTSDVARQRCCYGEERYEKEEFQNKVRNVFEKLRSEDAGMWHVIDASMSLDYVTSKVFWFSLFASVLHMFECVCFECADVERCESDHTNCRLCHRTRTGTTAAEIVGREGKDNVKDLIL